MKLSNLPSLQRPFYTVRKTGACFEVVVVTPTRRRALRTAVARYAVRSSAYDQARLLALETGRSFKIRGVVQ